MKPENNIQVSNKQQYNFQNFHYQIFNTFNADLNLGNVNLGLVYKF